MENLLNLVVLQLWSSHPVPTLPLLWPPWIQTQQQTPTFSFCNQSCNLCVTGQHCNSALLLRRQRNKCYFTGGGEGGGGVQTWEISSSTEMVPTVRVSGCAACGHYAVHATIVLEEFTIHVPREKGRCCCGGRCGPHGQPSSQLGHDWHRPSAETLPARCFRSVWLVWGLICLGD